MKAIRKVLEAISMAALVSNSALAAVAYPYTAAQFAKVTGAHKPVLVDISASWCPVCEVQKSVIQRELTSNPAFKDFIVLHVDFDSQKEVVRRFDATTQSMLIFFRDGKEVARLIGVTDPDVIGAMMRRAAE